MPQGRSYTLEELQQMGAKPIERSYTLDELQKMGAKPVDTAPPAATPARPLSTFDRIRRSVMSEATPVIDMAKGALKGAGSTAVGLIQGQQKIHGKAPMAKPAFLEPTNTAQKVGFGAEQIGEFMAPQGAIVRGAKALKTGSLLANMGIRAGLEAVPAATITSAQTGGDPKATVINTMIAAGFGAAAPLGKAVVDRLPADIFNYMLRPLSKEFRFGKNPGAALVDEGITAASTLELLGKIRIKQSDVGGQLDTVLKAYKGAGKVDIKGALPIIDDAIKGAAKANDQELANQLVKFRDSITDILVTSKDGKIVKTGVRKPTVLDPLRATDVKRDIGKNTKWTGQAYDNDLNQIKSKVYRFIDSEVDKLVPAAEKLNSRYGNLLSAQHAAERLGTMSPVRLSDFLVLAGVGAHWGVTGALIAAKKGLETVAGASLAATGVRGAPAIATAGKNVALGNRPRQ